MLPASKCNHKAEDKQTNLQLSGSSRMSICLEEWTSNLEDQFLHDSLTWITSRSRTKFLWTTELTGTDEELVGSFWLPNLTKGAILGCSGTKRGFSLNWIGSQLTVSITFVIFHKPKKYFVFFLYFRLFLYVFRLKFCIFTSSETRSEHNSTCINWIVGHHSVWKNFP